MKNKKWIILTVVAVTIIFFIVYGDQIGNSQAENTIKHFLNAKVALNNDKEKLRDLFEFDMDDKQDLEENGIKNIDEGKLDEILVDVRPFLTEKAYKRLIANRYFFEIYLSEEEYDDVDVEIYSYQEEIVNGEQSYIVDYTEKIIIDGEYYSAVSWREQFTLERLEADWIIKDIKPKSYPEF